MKLIRELLFCYIWRAFTNSSEVKYNVQRKLLFFSLYWLPETGLWLRDKYIYCLTCSYLAWPKTKYERGFNLSCQMPSKNDRVKILPLSQLWGRRQSCGYKWFCAASTPRHVFKSLKKTKMKLSSRSVCKF